MHDTQSQWIDLKVSDGSVMRAFTARPEGVDRAPGLFVFQEIFGVNGHIQEVCERYAREGYVAVAPELFHRTAPGFDAPYGDVAPGRAEAAQMTLEGLEADFKAVAGWFDADRQASGLALGAVGYCMGGRISFLANTVLPLACAISYYGGTIPNHLDRVSRLHAPHLFFWGGLDTAITWEQRPQLIDAMKAAGKPFIDVVFSGAHHGFNCDRRPEHFSPEASRQAMTLALGFLREHLG